MPARYCLFDDRGRIRASLKTTSLDTAKERRDAMARADDLYWASLSGLGGDQSLAQSVHAQNVIAQRRYDAAHSRAMARGFSYAPAEELAKTAELEELLERIKLVDVKDTGYKAAGEAAVH